MKIIKIGKHIKYNNLFKHKCSYCKTKFIYDLNKDCEINGITDTRLVVKCPNCDNYDFVESILGIIDKKLK